MAPVNNSSVRLAAWPLTQSTDWCGEWVARDEVRRG